MIFGKYQLLDILGRGGMAEVFKAKSHGVEGFEKLLVIKRILPTLTDNPRFVDMFINEAKIAVSLNHANIVQVFDLGKVEDSYYIAMEYVHGMDLATVIKMCSESKMKIPIELTAFIGSEVAKGLDYAHRRRDQNLEPLNIIHRDISPHNILLSFEGEVKITDFGIAKAKNTLLEKEKGTIKGKYAYMAPEQARGLAHDKRVDIFSLGVLLYEAALGANPFRGLSNIEILRLIDNKSYPSLADDNSLHVTAEMIEIVAKAMEPKPENRFSDAGELYEELIAFLYSTRTRVGAHSLSAFLNSLKKETEKEVNAGEFASDLCRSPEITSSAEKSVADDEVSAVTSIQVPTASQYDDSASPITGTSTLSAELREVTLLVMEFIGPAAPSNVLERYRSIISRNGGYVAEGRNDLIMGIFGLDFANGLDTQEAIETALKLKRASLIEESLAPHQVGIGVYPAKLVLTAAGVPREDDGYFGAVSSARGIAKRGVGSVVTSEKSRRLTSDRFRFEDITITTIEGVEQNICKVVGRRSVEESYGRLFGRREELRAIGEILAIVSKGTGQSLHLIGEAGTGKTRIMHEVKRRLIAGGHDVGWYEAICLPSRHAMPFTAVGTMFRSILAVDEVEVEEELKARIGRLRELGLIPEEIEAVSFLLGVAKDREVGPEERGRQLRSALVRATSSLCSDKMIILFWDDLNYVDKESFAIFEYLAASMANVPLLLTFASRPGLSLAFAEGSTYHQVGLNPLSESESKRLALSRMRIRRAPEELLIDIAFKSGGNPLYIEEYVKALIANKAVIIEDSRAKYRPEEALVDFPKTLRGLVGARINRLPVEQRGLLQRAAVLGQRFNVELFSHLIGIGMGDLKQILVGLKEMGLLTRLSSNEFAFASDLVRDVVYDGIVLTDKREIHALVAKSIEELYSDRIDEFVERLAVHYREGGERSKAVDYLIRAGEKVAADYSHQAAIDYYLKALELLQNVPRPDLERIISVYIPIGELAIKTNNTELGRKKMRLAEELAEELGDKRSLITILRLQAELQARADQYAEAQQYFAHSIELADELGDMQLRCEVRHTAGRMYSFLGDMKKVAVYYREAAEIASDSTNPYYLLKSYLGLASAQSLSDGLHEALETLSKAEKLIDEDTDPAMRIEFDYANQHVYHMTKNMEKVLHHAMRALDTAREYDMKDMVARHAHNVGDAYLWLGDYRKAFVYLRMSLEVAEKIGYEIAANVNKILLAFIDALKFGGNEGLTQLEKALQIANERNSVWEQIQVHYFLGKIHFERKEMDLAKSHLDQSIRIGRAADNKVCEAAALDLLEQIEESDSTTDHGKIE